MFHVSCRTSHLEALDDASQREAVVGAAWHGRRSQHALDGSEHLHRRLHEAVVELDVEAGVVALRHTRLQHAVDDRLEAVVVRSGETEDGEVALERVEQE